MPRVLQLAGGALAGLFFAFILAVGLVLAPGPADPPAPRPTPTASVPALPPCLTREPAQAGRPVPMGPRKITHVFLHHWGGTPGSPALALQAFTSRGYVAIAYNALVTADGQTWPGRPETMQSAATRGFNDRSVAICFLGDLTRAPATDAQLVAGGRWLASALKRYPGARFAEHADAGRLAGYSTACAGDHTAAPIVWQQACGYSLPEARRRAARR